MYNTGCLLNIGHVIDIVLPDWLIPKKVNVNISADWQQFLKNFSLFIYAFIYLSLFISLFLYELLVLFANLESYFIWCIMTFYHNLVDTWEIHFFFLPFVSFTWWHDEGNEVIFLIINPGRGWLTFFFQKKFLLLGKYNDVP